MKKFFALMLVVAMLSVAGTAMAVTGSASPATVNMTVGKVATSTVTGVAANDGDLSYSIPSSTPAWITLKDNVVTFRPTATANTSVVVTVTETYTTETDAGHSTATATADVTITVNVSPVEVEPEPEPEPEPQETTQVIVRKKATILRPKTIVVAIISTAARRAASVLTFAETVRSIAEAIVDSALLNRIGLSQALIQLWATKAAQVAQFAQTAINSPEKRAVLFPGLPEGTDTTPQDNSQLEEVAGSTNDDADAGTKLAAATEKLGAGRRALSAGGAVRPKKAGTYKFAKNFGSAFYKLPIQGDKGRKSGNTTANAFSAADADTSGVAFLDSQGNATTIIPGDDNSQDIMPGFVTMLVVMQAGQVYEPVVFTTDEALAEAGIASEDQTATVNEVAYEDETVVVDANGNATVQEEAPTSTVAKMTEALGIAPTLVPASALTSATAIKSADAAADRKYAASHDMFIAATYPAVGALPTGAVRAFYAPLTFNKLSSDQTLAASADFEFYPDGLGDSAEKAYVAVFTMSGDEVTTPSSILGKEGYIAFIVENEVFQAAAKDTVMGRPTVTLALKPVSGSVKPTPGPDSGDQPAVGDAVFEALKTAGYINDSGQLNDAAFIGGSRPTLTIAADGTYTATVSLLFDVSSWTLAVAENGSVTKQFTSSTIGTGSLTPTSSTIAKITLDPSEITFGERAVTLTVTPKGATHTASASLGNVIGTAISGGGGRLGSSGGGCSAGSAVLALALLGSFILTRKK